MSRARIAPAPRERWSSPPQLDVQQAKPATQFDNSC